MSDEYHPSYTQQSHKHESSGRWTRRTNRSFEKAMQRFGEAGVNRAAYNQCGNKLSYTKTKARTVAAQLQAEIGRSVSHYRCPFCRGWHIGKDHEPRQEST